MWHNLGKVNVTKGSDVVTGVGTKWVENVRVGDAFQGPDGKLYQVINVASDEALAISPVYEGSTAKSLDYWIVPIPGFSKTQADRLALIINRLDGDIAKAFEEFLRKDSNLADVKDKKVARDNLGLGAAATGSVVNSNTDAEGGSKLVTQGWMGLGGVTVPGLQGADDIDIGSRFYTAPSGHLGISGTHWGLHINHSAPGYATQMEWRRNSFHFRTAEGGVWSEPYKVTHSGNLRQATGSSTDYPMSQKAVTESITPIGYCYTQYPDTPTPSELFGGTWTLMFNTEGVFFRTEGQGASAFGSGVQGDAIRNIIGSVGAVGDTFAQSGAFRTGSTRENWFGSDRFTAREVIMDASRIVPTANENRPRNRTVRIWRKTAH